VAGLRSASICSRQPLAASPTLSMSA
jgi:hypothetical protein